MVNSFIISSNLFFFKSLSVDISPANFIDLSAIKILCQSPRNARQLLVPHFMIRSGGSTRYFLLAAAFTLGGLSAVHCGRWFDAYVNGYSLGMGWG